MANFLGAFSRITTSGRTFLPHIDGLRFVAIMAVIAFHVRAITSFHYGVSLESPAGSGDFVNELFGAGHFGVQLFFCISGFILVLPFARQYLQMKDPVNLRAYFLRRLTRLEPPYIIHLLFLLILCCTLYRHIPYRTQYYHNPGWFHYTWQHLTASLFYSNGFIFEQHPQPNIVLWSLEVEVQFYLLAPLLAQLFRVAHAGFRKSIMIGLMILAPITSAHLFPRYVAGFSLAGNLQYFLIGFLLCDLYLTRWENHVGRNMRWDLLWVLILPMITYNRFIPYFYCLLPWLYLLVGIIAFKGVVTGRFLSNPWIATIGGMCYTIYMYHWLMISALIRITQGFHTRVFWQTLIMQYLIMVPVIVAVCALLFILFERPFMRRDWPARLKNVLAAKPS